MHIDLVMFLPIIVMQHVEIYKSLRDLAGTKVLPIYKHDVVVLVINIEQSILNIVGQNDVANISVLCR